MKESTALKYKKNKMKRLEINHSYKSSQTQTIQLHGVHKTKYF